MVKNKKTGQDMIKEDWGDWGPLSSLPVGRPAKKDNYGNIIHRKPTSIYLDIRLKDWIQNKVGNLSNWVEDLIRKAYDKEYCFHCFDDNVKEQRHGWECTNPAHVRAGRRAPSTTLKWKMCSNCQRWFSDTNYPDLLSDNIDGCSECKREENLTADHKDIMSFKPSEKNDTL